VFHPPVVGEIRSRNRVFLYQVSREHRKSFSQRTSQKLSAFLIKVTTGINQWLVDAQLLP